MNPFDDILKNAIGFVQQTARHILSPQYKIPSPGENTHVSVKLPSPQITRPKTAPIDNYLQSLVPAGQNQTVAQYFPAYQDISTRSADIERQYNRPGFRNLALATALHESTLGRAQAEGKAWPFNYFGFRPPASAGFRGYPDSNTAWQSYVDHMLGKKGYLLPVLKGKGPITKGEVDKLYSAYNPDKVYLNKIMQFFADDNTP